jgi:hypothetical protein
MVVSDMLVLFSKEKLERTTLAKLATAGRIDVSDLPQQFDYFLLTG